MVRLMPGLSLDSQLCDGNTTGTKLALEFNKSSSFEGDHLVNKFNDADDEAADGNKSRFKRSSSTSDLKAEPDTKKALTGDVGGPIISESYSPDFGRHSEEFMGKIASNMVLCNEGSHIPKLRCRVSIPVNIAASYANLKFELQAESICDMGYRLKQLLELSGVELLS